MTKNFEKLQKLLEELFQLDQADLDFGIYRIMNQKRDEIVQFLEKDLLPQVKEAFGQYQSSDKSELQKELTKLEAQVTSAGMNPNDSPKVQELRQKMADSSVDITALENDVFSHLYNFFRRYYSEGDFISQRRYKEGVYAIPYEGEEVKLHWANHDQYYVKSSEYLRDYTFKLPSGKRVRVHLVAASTEQDNKKEAPGKVRRFSLCKDDPLYEEKGELFIRFQYDTVEGKSKQDFLNKESVEQVLESSGFDEWILELAKPAPTPKNPDRTVLEKHLTQYTARNTFDYFIHKDLGGFLRRELNFYIKNEVMHLDDIEHDTAPRVEQYLSKIKVIRKVAHKIIQFLEQLENFQKKLWLKKKFVVETNYCITLDRVPEELYEEIAANDAQQEEWVRLFAIDEIEKDLNGPGYSKPLKVDFLKANCSLVIDTRFYSSLFRDQLLSLIDELDEQCDCLLFNSDNFHALTFVQNRFRDCVSCIYIDPPYNTGNDGFIYKDSYQHSSWLSCIHDRLSLAKPLMTDLGSLFMSIDDNEQVRLREVTDSVIGDHNFIATVIWQKVYSPKNSARHFSEDHDFVLVYARNANQWTPSLLPRTEEANARYQNFDNDPRGPWKPSDLTARNYYSKGRYEIVGPTGKRFTSGVGRFWRQSEKVLWEMDADNRIWWGPNKDSMPAQKRFLSEVQQGRVPQTLWPYKEVGHTQQAKKELLSTVPYSDNSDVLNTVKPVGLIRRVIQLGTEADSRSIVLDFFAGSGTTIQAIFQQNAEDGGDRKVIAVELGEYFDTTTRIRAIRSLSSPTWKDGVPVGVKSGSGIIKYIRLESYEDALNNLDLKRSSQQGTLLDEDDKLREEYTLSYMLDVESRGSQSLLNVDSFRNPDEYKLKAERNGETQLVNVDLVETFNWLLGLTVKHIDVIQNIRVVEGTNPEGNRVLVLWRNLDKTDNDTLDEWFQKQDYNTKDQEYDIIYVNGDNNIENLRRADQTWKVRLIEEEFGRLMFDVEDV